MSTVAALLHAHGKKLAVCVQSGCGDDHPGWRDRVAPNCATLYRAMPWADLFTDMGTYAINYLAVQAVVDDRSLYPCALMPFIATYRYPVSGKGAITATELQLQECPPPANKLTRWCGLEGQVLNHIRPLPSAATEPQEASMAGRYSAGLWPRSCVNGTVAGRWTQPTLHAFLVFLDLVGVRSVDIWCTSAAMPCPTLVGKDSCTWFVSELAWWKSNGL